MDLRLGNREVLNMMLPIVGSIRNTVNLAVMDSKWQQKKKNGGVLKEEMDPQARQIMQYKEDLAKMRESKQMASIDAKLNSGGLLTPEEITYLQNKCPEKYREYVELKNEREAYKRQMESCKTKEEVEKLKLSKMNSFLVEAKSVKNNPNIPEGKKKELMEKILRRTMGIQDEYMEFVRSGRYKELPTEEELAEEKREKAGQNIENSEVENPNQEENKNEISEKSDGTENKDGLEQKEMEIEGENIKISQETKKSEINKLPDSKQAADMVFQEIEMELKEHLKGYMP